MTNKQLIEKHIEEVFNKNNLSYADQVCSPTLVFHDPVLIDAPIGPEAVKIFARTYREAFPDLHVGIVDIIEEKDKVAVVWKGTGTHKGPLFGLTPTKKFVTVTGMTFYKIVKGSISEITVQWDVLQLFRELDVKLPVKFETEMHV
jgi:steroid delta-isomerase-like uncharacterized protein